MRLVNRPLALVLAAALVAASIVIIVEVIGFAAHRSPLLVHWSTWYHWGGKPVGTPSWSGSGPPS